MSAMDMPSPTHVFDVVASMAQKAGGRDKSGDGDGRRSLIGLLQCSLSIRFAPRASAATGCVAALSTI
jgi:hypothetical protein